jgi:hypothetical protein
MNKKIKTQRVVLYDDYEQVKKKKAGSYQADSIEKQLQVEPQKSNKYFKVESRFKL